MSEGRVRAGEWWMPLVSALLHEGTLLYPYRPALKNARPMPLSAIVPREWKREVGGDGEFETMQAQCLLRSAADDVIRARAYFLQLSADGQPAERHVSGEDVPLAALCEREHRAEFSFDGYSRVEGELTMFAESARSGLHRLTVRITNRTPIENATTMSRDEALLHSFVSPQLVISYRGGSFVSSIDPPRACRGIKLDSIGLWPALLGEKGCERAMLCSPTILEDHPRIAPESPGDFFDATEIDEMLALRVMTLTDEEKARVAGDARASEILKRTADLSPEDWLRLHGAGRGRSAESRLVPGDRVRLKPRHGADAFDTILAGQTATVVSVERDFEDRVHLAVTIDADPGAQEGRDGRIGHRFFFFLDEVEPLR